MSDHGAHHEEDKSGELKSKTAFKSSFWVVLILAGMFIAALNFIQVMSHGEGHEGHEAKEEPASSISVHEESRPVSPTDDTTNMQHEPAKQEAPAAEHH